MDPQETVWILPQVGTWRTVSLSSPKTETFDTSAFTSRARDLLPRNVCLLKRSSSGSVLGLKLPFTDSKMELFRELIGYSKTLALRPNLRICIVKYLDADQVTVATLTTSKRWYIAILKNWQCRLH